MQSTSTLIRRHNLHTYGSGALTLLFVHGYGCGQSMWRNVAPALVANARIVLMDLMGCGQSDFSAYSAERYATLHGHADDLVNIAREFGHGPVVVVGHSVGCMVGMLAELQAPELIAGHVMVAPSPCYINDGEYLGGLERAQVLELMDAMDQDFVGWSRTVAKIVLGSEHPPTFSQELVESFCSAEPTAARQLARVTFLGDFRQELGLCRKPSLLLQCTDDPIAPVAVGQYMQQQIAGSQLRLIKDTGHCPHLTSPGECIAAIEAFCDGLMARNDQP